MRGARGSPLVETEGGGFLWARSSTASGPAAAAAWARRQKKEDEESLRLLYVALTRARDRLVLCGRINARTKEDNLQGWWRALNDAFADPAIAPQVRRVNQDGFEFQRFGPDPARTLRTIAGGGVESPAPAWARAPARPDAFARYASPSDLGEGAVAPTASPLARARGLGRFRRGELIHRLLQVLPDLAPDVREASARRMLAREPDLAPDQAAEMIEAAFGVLNDARFAEVFGPGSRPEVAIAGGARRLPPGLSISGRLDRLVVLPDRVLVADFKTNRPSPDRIEDADPAYLRQMALYAAVLGEVFPDRPVEAALVWTDGPKLMPIPELLLAQSLASLAKSG
jgi:ATP-dependent helicase/nuclease subunit A